MSFCDVRPWLVGRCAFLTALLRRLQSRPGTAAGSVPCRPTGDRHVGRDDVEPRCVNCVPTRCLRDGVREPAAEGVDVALVAGGLDLAGNRRAVDADDQVCVVVRRCRPTPRPRRGFRPTARSEPNRATPDDRHRRCRADIPVRPRRAASASPGGHCRARPATALRLASRVTFLQMARAVPPRRRSPRPSRRCSRLDSRSTRAPACRRWRRAARGIARRRTTTARIARHRSLPCARCASHLRPDQSVA